MGKTWVISDQHFYHKNIIQLGERPFESIEEMNEVMISHHNNLVEDGDRVYHLGDFSFGTKEQTKEILSRLKGVNRLVMGNHDRSHSVRWWYDCGFNKVYDKPILIKDFYLLTHEPLQWSATKLPFAILFGHVHQRPEYRTITNSTFCVCVERWAYMPIELEYTHSLMKLYTPEKDYEFNTY